MRDARLRRLKIRSWRRGMKEMDLILGSFCDSEAASMTDAELDELEELMSENDQELYQWISGQALPPAHFGALVSRIGRHAGAQ
jgi:antitoxin CptB